MVTFPVLVREVSKGVNVVALSNGFLRSASVAFLVGRGSHSDPIEGCACIDNSMRLRLTSKLDSLALQASMDRLGATIDAVTDRDYMLLRAQVPSKKLEDCLRLLAELYAFPSFPTSELDKEKASQRLAYEKIMQDPMTASMTNVWEAAFPRNPLGHPVTGYPKTIEKITPKTLKEFDEQTRQTAPLVISIVSKQREETLVDWATSSIENISIKPSQEKIILGPRREFNVLRTLLQAQQTTFTVGAVTRGASSPDYPALLLLEDCLGSQRHYAGTLFKELREKRGLTYFPGARLFTLKPCGLLTAHAGVKHEKVSEALRLTLKCMKDLGDKALPEKSLKELKTLHRQIIETMLEVPSRASTWLALSFFRAAEADPESYISKIEAVTPENIRKTAEKSLKASGVSLSIAGKPPSQKNLVEILKEGTE
ncbi:MAG TPA: pitrilysin family protein [Candidatus Acidoferrales bacterium]|nr:pitrilysin family protein [Candidatus Acidoferrales bacterium]